MREAEMADMIPPGVPPTMTTSYCFVQALAMTSRMPRIQYFFMVGWG